MVKSGRPTLIPPDALLQLRVTLARLEPRVWRRVVVRAADTLLDLHRVVQAAMGWTDSHLHQFEIGRERYGDPELMDDPSVTDERAMPLFQAFEAGAEVLYEYDFGDGWEHRIELEELAARQPRLRYPRCVDGARACPPEDCGGPHAYPDFLAALANPGDPRHQELRDWIGGRFDAEAFSVKAANERISAFVAPRVPKKKPRAATLRAATPRAATPRAATPRATSGEAAPPGSFHHLAIQVADLPRAERFYCDVLGLQVRTRWPFADGRPGERSLWLALGAGFLALEACEQPAPARAFRDPRAGLHLFAIAIAAGDRAAWEQRLGAAIVHRTPFTLYVLDPEGNRIGLSHHPVAAP